MNYLLLFSLMTALFPTLLSGQTRSLSGRVLDTSEKLPLAGANIEIVNTAWGTATDAQGMFEITHLPPGIYTLRVTYIGYKPVHREVDVRFRQSTELTIFLTLQAIEGESIIVTARAEPNQAVERESPVAFTRLSRPELVRNYTTGDLPELIKEVPGVWTSSAGLGESEIYIRGFPSGGIRFMINDIPVNNPEDHQVFWSDWAGISNFTRAIEVQRGPGFGLYSSNAFGGSVNITTVGIEDQRVNSFRISSGMFHRMGIPSGPDKGKYIDPQSGAVSSYHGIPVNYTYSGRFNSGPMYDGKLNTSFFFERKYGDSYIRGTEYNGYTIGLEAESSFKNHKLQLSALLSTQYHGQAFALQDIDLIETLGREYNRKSHEWQENFYTKPFLSLKHEWRLSPRRILTNNLFFTLGKGADQSCANDAFNTQTGEIGFQPCTRRNDAYAFGMHAIYLYLNYGLLTSEFVPGKPGFSFKGIPGEDREGTGANFFADLHSHSYQDRRRRDHRQIGLVSYISDRISERLSYDYGLDSRYWRGHRNNEVRLLRVTNLESYRPLDAPVDDPNQIPFVQNAYDYDTDVLNLSGFGRITWKPGNRTTIQGGIQLNYTRAEVIENPIKMIDFGTWGYFDTRLRTTADMFSYRRKFGLTNEYLRQYLYITPWIGVNFNMNERVNLFARIAQAKKEPSILDWYDFSSGPLIRKDIYPDEEVAVNLKPESVTSLEFGGAYRTTDWSLQANYYHSIYSDKIESVVDINDRYTTLNAGRALFRGIEMMFRRNWTRFDFGLAATLARNRWQNMNVREIFDQDAGEVVGKVVPFAPERMISSSLGYRLLQTGSHQLRAGLRLNYWDEYYGTYTNTYLKTVERIVDGLHFKEVKEHEARLPYFLDLSGHVSYRVVTKSLDVTFRIDANNMLNRADNFMRARYTVDYTRDDFQGGRYNWYVLQAPLFNIFFTTEISIRE